MRTKKLLAGVLLVGLWLMVGSTAVLQAATKDDEVAALKQQVADLNAKIAQLEARQASAVHPASFYDADEDYFADPFAQMQAMQERMDRMMNASFGPGFGMGPRLMGPAGMSQSMAFNAGYDLKETDKNYVVTMDLPGMDKSRINVEVKEGLLHVSGERSSESKESKGGKMYRQERSFGYFSRVVPLPKDAKSDSVEAAYDKGVLTVTIARKEPQAVKAPAGKKIEVK